MKMGLLKNKNIQLRIIVFAMILMVFQGIYGLGIIIPTNINWLLSVRHDWGTHYLGWAFYRQAPWAFPLGIMNNVCYPIGTNVGFFDNVPGLSVFFKLFSAILPDDFQYLGAWLLFCHLMAAHYSLRIFSLYNTKSIYAILGAFLIACNPVLVYRGMHPALCAHFLLLASLYLYLMPVNRDNIYRVNTKQLILLVAAALINPYLAFMVAGFNVILPVKHYFYDRLLSLKKMFLFPVASLFSAVSIWFIIGMVTFQGNSSLSVNNSYQLYGFNLNSLFNSGGYSVFFPFLPRVTDHQYEGYMYLGLGMFLLIIVTIIYTLIKGKSIGFAQKNKFLWPLFVFMLLSALFAVSNRVTYGNHILFEYPVPKIIVELGDTFRACGRVSWIPFYICISFVMIAFAKSKLPAWFKSGFLIAIIFIQGYDLQTMYFRQHWDTGTYNSPLDEAKWNALLPSFSAMITYPPFNNSLLYAMDYQDLSFLALKNHMAISLGYTGREDFAAEAKYTDSLTQNLTKGVLSNEELYVTTPKHLDAFSVLLHNKKVKVKCIDGYYILYASEKKISGKPEESLESRKKEDSVMQAYSHTVFKKNSEESLINRSSDIRSNFDEVVSGENYIKVKGWAFDEGTKNNSGDSVFVALSHQGKLYLAQTIQQERPDITTAYKGVNLSNSGFQALIFTEGFDKSDTLGLVIKKPTGQFLYKDISTIKDQDKSAKPLKSGALPPANKQIGNIDEFVVQQGHITLSGWTAFEDADSYDNQIKVIFSGKENYMIKTATVIRNDVTQASKEKYNFDSSGFKITVELSDLPQGTYKVGLYVKNYRTGRESAMMTDKKVEVKHG